MDKFYAYFYNEVGNQIHIDVSASPTTVVIEISSSTNTIESTLTRTEAEVLYATLKCALGR